MNPTRQAALREAIRNAVTMRNLARTNGDKVAMDKWQTYINEYLQMMEDDRESQLTDKPQPAV